MSSVMVVLGVAALMAGPFAKPMSNAPTISKSASEVEALRQVDYLLESRESEMARVEAIAERLLRANADLCPATRPRIGLRTATVEDFKPAAFKDAAVRKWGVTDRVRVISLTPNSPAKLAGVQVGDEILSLDGLPVETGRKATERWGKQLSTVLEASPATVRLTIQRGGESREVEVAPIRACAYDVLLDTDSNDLNAYADGKRIVLTRAISRLASTDSELGLVIAHELAHNARRHIAAQKRNAATGMIGGAALDILAAAAGVNTEGAFMKAGADMGAGMYSPEFEAEADYVGMYFLARAGFQTEGVENFWRKMAAEHPRAIYAKGSHPPTPDRYLAIASAREEILGRGGDIASLTPIEKASAKAGAKPAEPAVAAR